jgi:voltage-gated sodium channel
MTGVEASGEQGGRLWRIVESNWFTTAVLLVIFANAIVFGLQTYPGIERDHGDTLNLLNEIFLWFFVVEIVVRVAAYGRRPWRFFRSGWNVFDFVVVGLAFVPGVRESSTLLRLARLMRVVRVIHVLPDLRILLEGVARSLPPLGSMVLLMVLVVFVYGMFGWLLFGEEIPDRWGNIGRAMLTCFVMLTLEDFPVYMDAAMDIHPWSWIYFVSFIGVAAFVVVNVLIAIVLNSMEEAREVERRRRVLEDRKLREREGPVAPAPVLERITILRSALDELEEELAEIPAK